MASKVLYTQRYDPIPIPIAIGIGPRPVRRACDLKKINIDA